MEQGRLKMFGFLLKFTLLFQLTYCINRPFGADENQQSEVYERMLKIEAHSRHQEKEISILKTQKIEDRNEISELRNRVDRLEASSVLNTQNITHKEVVGPRKRPFRLLPQNHKEAIKEPTARGSYNFKGFYDPPTSCSDLGDIGHTLNGYYLVKRKLASNSTKIQTVYCQFNQPQEAIKGAQLETRIGVVDVKSSLVIFCVESVGRSGSKGKNKITFDRQILNIGEGYDWINQWFVAPYPGTYFFSISGTKNTFSTELRACITVKLNGEYKGFGEAVSSDYTAFGGYSYQFTRKLNATDKIELFFKFGNMPWSVYFTGWLLDEDLTKLL